MRICMITSSHSPDDLRMTLKEARTLKEAGYEISIICGATEALDNGIEYVTVKIPKSKLFKKIFLNFRMKRAVKSVAVAAFHIHDFELLNLAKWLKKHKKKVILDLHAEEEKNFSLNFSEKEKNILPELDVIICANNNLLDRVQPLDVRAILISDYEVVRGFEETEKYNNRENLLFFMGELSEENGVLELIDATVDTDVTLVLAGEWKDNKIKREVLTHEGYKNVTLLQNLSEVQKLEYFYKAKAGIVTRPTLGEGENSINFDVFRYMGAGLPIIAYANAEMIKLMSENNCGVCVDTTSPKDMAATIRYIFKNTDGARGMGESGMKNATKKYNWQYEGRKLVAVYKLVLGKQVKKEEDWQFEGGQYLSKQL